ncbi:MAG: DNA mismatch repair endonuclease MutL, partial [Bdellovibrionota bacterium]
MQSPARVKLLDPVVAERIAAGEVIERPSSVVKELVENSIDAGATEIAVVLSDGGKGLIEILDNGHGMQPEDLAICVQRHATSKLSSLQDLEKILTLGFRGEALPSIAAVSEMSILSRAQGAETAYEIREASARAVNPRPEAVTFGHFLNSPHGTRIRAAGLFSQVPARLKFLKSQGAEVSQVREWLERLALAHPKIGFRLVSDDRTVLTLKPQTEVERVRAILADGEDFPIVSAESERNGFQDRGLTVRAHWVQGLSTPQTRRLVQVVNGRAVRDRMLQQALLAPFRQALLPGQFPAVALFIEISPAAIDVNVHPTKTELRFLDSRKVFHEVERLVDSLIAKHGAAGYTPSAQPGPQAQPFFLNAGSRAFEAPIQQQTSIFSAPSWNASEATPESAKAPEPALHPLKFGRYVGV